MPIKILIPLSTKPAISSIRDLLHFYGPPHADIISHPSNSASFPPSNNQGIIRKGWSANLVITSIRGPNLKLRYMPHISAMKKSKTRLLHEANQNSEMCITRSCSTDKLKVGSHFSACLLFVIN